MNNPIQHNLALGEQPAESINLLPYDGNADYFGEVFHLDDSNRFFDDLKANIDWQHDQAVIYGKRIVTKRKVAWHADQPFHYRYSQTSKVAKPWTSSLLTIKQHIEELSGETFNACLLNLYHSGQEGMAYHSDGEHELKKQGAIASVSFGAKRPFFFKHKHSGERIDIELEHGSLLIMRGKIQDHWLHSLPIRKRISQVRINLTFRYVMPQNIGRTESDYLNTW